MTQPKLIKRHRLWHEIIQHAVWLYHRFNLSHHDVEDRLAERGVRKFKAMEWAQHFLNTHAAVYNLLNLGRHLVSAENYRCLRWDAFAFWESAVEM